MKLLVLDLATHLGFAFGDGAGVQDHGSFRLPSTGPDLGQFLHAYRAWLAGKLRERGPEKVVFESPILPSTTNLNTCRKLYALAALTELLCLDARIDCGEANLMEIRRHFIGSARAPRDVPQKERRAWLKDATEGMCRARGFNPADDNDADALALFSFVQSTVNPNFELLGTEIARAA
jgi:hypothetical protein